jgi:hypothetical protein
MFVLVVIHSSRGMSLATRKGVNAGEEALDPQHLWYVDLADKDLPYEHGLHSD